MAETGKSKLEMKMESSNVLSPTADVAPPAQPNQQVNGSALGSGDHLAKRRRGRPRKSDVVAPPVMIGRGRPQGSGNPQVLHSPGSAATDFQAQVIDVFVGEDVTGKIMSLTQGGPRGLCVLSANGDVSNVELRQPGPSSGVISYEGQFQLLSLNGPFTFFEVGGVRSRTGGFTASLAGPRGQVIGGEVAGPLVAASPIQAVIGRFGP